MTTKDKLIRVVVEYIKQDIDVNQISISEIAKKANIGKSTVYEYFENKETLIGDTYIYLLEHYEEQILKPLKQQTFKKAFIEQITRIIAAMSEAKKLVETILIHHKQTNFLKNDNVDHKMLQISQHMEERFKEIFYLGVTENEISDKLSGTPQKGYVVQALVTGLLFQYINKQTNLTEKEVIDLIYDEVYRVLQ